MKVLIILSLLVLGSCASFPNCNSLLGEAKQTCQDREAARHERQMERHEFIGGRYR